MDEDDLFRIYSDLWKLAEADGAYVSYQGTNAEMAGYFAPTDPPNIAIFRPYHRSPPYAPSRHRIDSAPLGPPDLLAELCTLAHEYGHLRSYRDSARHDRWLQYQQTVLAREAIVAVVANSSPELESRPAFNERQRKAMIEGLKGEQVDLILEEESLAWSIGSETLVTLGFTDLRYYDERARIGLHNHRYRLAVDELWPEDLETVASPE